MNEGYVSENDEIFRMDVELVDRLNSQHEEKAKEDSQLLQLPVAPKRLEKARPFSFYDSDEDLEPNEPFKFPEPKPILEADKTFKELSGVIAHIEDITRRLVAARESPHNILETLYVTLLDSLHTSKEFLTLRLEELEEDNG